ncbi:hypothetical protein [Eisenibacter elegans]|jgi:hypothetical protein|uniref:hypothetical protein n=1 Tax=Eisenibacter elegans TaxID=997 RepID=UPI00041FA397|nr:hypothetical protein [Eisenibacter elegans]
MFRYGSLLLLLSLVCCSVLVHAQEEIEEEFPKELVYGVNLNTNGGLLGGLMFRYAKISPLRPRTYNAFSMEIVGVKHPKEIRVPSIATGNSFIFGKRNYLFSVRPSYEKNVILFRKAEEEGVRVIGIFGGGPSLGIAKPYHILYRYGPGDIRSEAYDPDVHFAVENIFGTGGFFDGFDNAQYILGGHARIALNLEFGAFRNSVAAVEAGFTVELFSRDIELMNLAGRDRLFTAAYLSFMFGSRK